jgi:Tfp pilus assembly protein PilZ
MENSMLINSLSIGAAIFAGFILLWFLRIFFKRRMTKHRSNQTLAATSKTSWEEKRKHPRIAISWPGRIETSRDSMAILLKDISAGGAFVVYEKPLPLTEKFRLTINAPDYDALTLNAEVVWSNANVPEDKVINRGMGIRFIENTEEDRSIFNHILQSYLKENEEQLR